MINIKSLSIFIDKDFIMKKEELLNIEFNTQVDLFLGLCDFLGFKKASDYEKQNWPYNSDLFISIDNIKGRELYNKKNFLIGVVEDCYFGKGPRGHKAVLIKSGNKEYSLTESKVKIYNKFSDSEELVDLHPSRKGIKFWSNGHILSEKDYKSLYYKTKEYRNQYEKSLNESLGTNGIKAPIQSKKIKDKISKTMDDRYGVNWFLERGCHYSAVTMTMQDKFGVDNLFNSHDWQIENAKNLSVGISKIEIEFVNYVNSLVEDLYPNYSKYSEFFNSKKQRDGVYDYKYKRTYNPDFINKKLKIFIEFNGDYWHCNPSIFNENYYNSLKGMEAKELWEKDFFRNERIKKITGCDYLVVWESDWNKNRIEVENNLKKFLNDKK